MTSHTSTHLASDLTRTERLRFAYDRARGIPIHTDLSPYARRVEEIARFDLASLSNEALPMRAQELRRRARGGVKLDTLLVEAFALAAEAAAREVGLRPYPVQLAAAIVLHEGGLAQMNTGEGKTLAAVPAAFLATLAGERVHIFTANDYLASRDAEWMRPVYERLGCSVASIVDLTDADEKRSRYAADVVYLTARRAGFDLLADRIAADPAELLQSRHSMVIVDEADAILIDEARVPLVIAAADGDPTVSAVDADRVARRLDPALHFTIDRVRSTCALTLQGIDAVQHDLDCAGIETVDGLPYYSAVTVALHAHHLLVRDVDYIVREGGVELVDEFTGRTEERRRWPYGLQTALEVKEGVEVNPEGSIRASITVGHLVERYERVSAMTATATSAARELWETYGLQTVVIPPNRPSSHTREADRVFTSQRAKLAALTETIRDARNRKRPVLIGTRTIEESQRVADVLHREGIASTVLNAKNDAEEARIIAEAGIPGAVTISTNMAGRGTDIRLGGSDEREREAALAAGGLLVIGTTYHESPRIDDQLAGRTARQGDPGTSVTLASLEDDLVTRYGIREFIPHRLLDGTEEGEIPDPRARREIRRAQAIVETQHARMRRELRRFSELIERKRGLFDDVRRAALTEQRVPEALQRRCLGTKPDSDSADGDADRLVYCFLATLDDEWSRFLEWVTTIREGIHLRRYAGRDPLLEFVADASEYFEGLVDRACEKAAALHEAHQRGEAVPRRPPVTWTYVVNDDPLPGFSVAAVAGGNIAAALVHVVVGLFLPIGRSTRRLRRRPIRSPRATRP